MANREHSEQIEKILVAAHRRRPEIALDNGWSQRVMSAVHREQRLSGSVWIDSSGQRFVWRCAVTAGVLAMLAMVYVMATGVGPEQLVVGLLLDDPSVTSLLQIIAL